MEKLVQQVKQFWNDESGVTAVEYAIMIAAVGAVVLAAGTPLGTALTGYFNGIAGLLPAP
ncbi:Flp family type IVb pilin [Nitrosomonas sp. Is24]|uniref:Flp family type IVb pilin n=1 Tax=Nitrosomonas sp. Is24 TaxID=3080533 RepID=UPI00294AFC2B|nr:Flp family type IVb pilin [Nitrosomonas sp. Is24]MDV6342324.1 Flp family type IVb pilin [Nitrosomonas sp. Is24]